MVTGKVLKSEAVTFASFQILGLGLLIPQMGTVMVPKPHDCCRDSTRHCKELSTLLALAHWLLLILLLLFFFNLVLAWGEKGNKWQWVIQQKHVYTMILCLDPELVNKLNQCFSNFVAKDHYSLGVFLRVTKSQTYYV